jgi:hypothetical protein
MRVPRVQFTVRRLIGAITIVALILALVIQSERAARLERELTASQELTRMLRDELIDSRGVTAELWKVLDDELSPAQKVLARQRVNAKGRFAEQRAMAKGRSKALGPPKGRSPGAERVPSGRGRDRREPPSPGPVK